MRKAISIMTAVLMLLGIVLSNPIKAGTEEESTTILVHKMMYESGKSVDNFQNTGDEMTNLNEALVPWDSEKYGNVSFTIFDIEGLAEKYGIRKPLDEQKLNQLKDKIKSEYEGENKTEFLKTLRSLPNVAEFNKLSHQTTRPVQNGIATINVKTNKDEKGNVVPHLYAIIETQSPAGIVSSKAEPMLITLPRINNDGVTFKENIHLYPKNETNGVTAVLEKFTQTDKAHQIHLKGAKFDLYSGEPGKGTKIGETLTSDGNLSKVEFKKLLVGKYYIVEVPSDIVMDPYQKGADKKEYLLSSDARNNKDNKLTFEVTKNGASNFGFGLTNYKRPTSDKVRVTDVSEGVELGDELDYKATIDIPLDIKGVDDALSVGGKPKRTPAYSVFNYTDKPSKALGFPGTEDHPKDLTVMAGTTKLEEGTDYKYEKIEPNSFKLDFIVDGGKVTDKLAAEGGKQLVITYKMVIKTQPKQGQTLRNVYKFEYLNGPQEDGVTPPSDTNIVNKEDPDEMADPDDENLDDNTDEDTDVKTFGFKFKKVDDGLFGSNVAKTGIADAEFKIQNAAGEYYTNKSTEENPKPWSKDEGQALVLKSGENGEFEISGLKKGTYKIIETKAPVGYIGKQAPIEFVITDSTGENVDLEIENTRESGMPFTGGEKLVIIFGSAFLLILVGVGFAVSSKKRKVA